MMRGPETTAMSVRLPDGTINTESWPTNSAKQWYRKTVFIRGIFHMADSLSLGYKCLMRSAEKSGMSQGKPSRFEKWVVKKFPSSIYTVMSSMYLIIAIVLAICLFTVLPTVITGFINAYLPLEFYKSFVEGVIKLGIFLLYLILVSKMRDIQRVFEYHGAEHKTISCYEAGKPLTVENARQMPRFHPRCGTSFLLIVMVISILIFSIITIDQILLRILLKIAMLPLVVGVAYETIKLAGRHDNMFTRVISKPGLWFQRLTTREPNDRQLEIAIASVILVLPKDKGTDKW